MKKMITMLALVGALCVPLTAPAQPATDDAGTEETLAAPHDAGETGPSEAAPAIAAEDAGAVTETASADMPEGEPDPGDLVGQLVALTRDGKMLAAAFVGLMLVVMALRWMLLWGDPAPTSWRAWFKTKVGGLVLGFGSALVFAVGGPLAAGQPFSLSLLAAALAAAWGSAGAWGHAKDAKQAVTK